MRARLFSHLGTLRRSLTHAAHEESNALDVRSVREHVDYARRGETEALGVDQHARVAGERRRVAGDVDDAPRPSRRQRLHDLDRAFARRVDQQLVERRVRIQVRLDEIHDFELHREPVQRRVLPRTLDEVDAALEPDYLGAARGEGQGEIPEAAEEIGDALAGLRVEQAHGARYEYPVDAVVHLGEVGRPEGEPQPEFGQPVVKLAFARVERVRAFRPARLKPYVNAFVFRKSFQFEQIFVVEWIEVPDDEHGGVVACRDLDLRQPRPDRQRFHQRSKWQDEGADLPGKDVALAHVGDVARALLPEPDHRAALLRHVARAQPR